LDIASEAIIKILGRPGFSVSRYGILSAESWRFLFVVSSSHMGRAEGRGVPFNDLKKMKKTSQSTRSGD
jgi:hypothetical protein